MCPIHLNDRSTTIHRESRQTHGSPRVHAALRQDGMRCSRKRVARLVLHSSISGCRVRRRTLTTRIDPAYAPAPNLVERRFTVEHLDRLWVGDTTSVPARSADSE